MNAAKAMTGNTNAAAQVVAKRIFRMGEWEVFPLYEWLLRHRKTIFYAGSSPLTFTRLRRKPSL
jgi:hypothetical protein